jgi:alkylation response protein AidB-like acyl-CoA dehydrogenase
MTILLDEGQQAIATESRRIAEARADQARALALLEGDGSYEEGWWAMAGEQGWTALAVPEDHDGLGLGLVELGQVALGVGATLAGAPFLTGGFAVADAIARHGDQTAKADWLGGLAGGAMRGAMAIGEGPDPLPLTPMVTLSGGHLSGTKTAVTGGLHADLALLLANEDGVPRLCIASLTGVERRRITSFDNSRGPADLVFDGTPATPLGCSDAVGAALDVLARCAIVTAFEQVGGAEALMFRARDYAITRKAFGQPIGAFQSVKHRIAELYGLVEIARANALHAAANAEGPQLVRHAAAARLAATEAYDTAARDCIQIHGGIGVTWEAGLHLHMRRTRTLAIEGGNMIFWEDRLVDDLGGEMA